MVPVVMVRVEDAKNLEIAAGIVDFGEVGFGTNQKPH